MGQSTRSKVAWVASKARHVLEVDFRSFRTVWVIPFIRVKILLDVAKPLCPDFFIPRANRGGYMGSTKIRKDLRVLF